jgi:hypothetical protein
MKKFHSPHNINILSIFYGTLLGDSHLEKRYLNVRISFQQENKNIEYLHWLWKILADAGYCSPKKPLLRKKMGSGDRLRFYSRFSTYTFSSLNYLYDEFYKDNSLVKRVPDNIHDNLTPLALACWIMDHGRRVGQGIKLSIQGFREDDVILLKNALYLNWGIGSNLQKTGKINQWIIYIPKSEVSKVQLIVEPFIVKSMLYKIHK